MGPAINSRGVLGFCIFTPGPTSEKKPKNGRFLALCKFIFSELLKIGQNDSPKPSVQFLRGLRLFYFHTLTK